MRPGAIRSGPTGAQAMSAVKYEELANFFLIERPRKADWKLD